MKVAAALVLATIASTSAAAGAREATLRVDAARSGAPISPDLYGQFIEHLGRCIYGGLWAEMLEDRKFFYPVTGEAPAWEMFKPGPRSWDGAGVPYELLVRSPWMVVGGPKVVAMVRDGAYVGDHSPRITLPGAGAAAGIVQERLGLMADHEYVGRIVVAADPSAAPLEVSLAWGGGGTARQTIALGDAGPGFRTHPLRFRSGGTTDNGRLEIVSRGTGSFTVGTVSLMPADNVLGWRADTLALLKELDSPVYRWPGGNFVSGYDWKDGIGDPDRRPPRKNPAWKGVEPNDVGLHEFVTLCRLIDAAPYVAVNTGLGGPESAAALVEYANGAPGSPMGRLRAENGATRPFAVKLWAVGNEMYGDWQLGHMPLEKYVEKHKAVVDAMRAVDRDIQPVAVGALGEWSRTMLGKAASHMAQISEHLYWQDEGDVPAHVAQVVQGIRRVAEAHRAYRREIPGLAGRDIRVALDEWNFWYGPNEYGELGTRYFLQDALGIAAGLHEMFRQSDVFAMANYAQTVNVIGAIKTTTTAAEMETTGLVLSLYRRHFGTLPVTVDGVPVPLDAAAAWTADRSTLVLAVVNPSAEPHRLHFEIAGADLSGVARRFALAGQGPRAFNAPGRPRQVDVEATSLPGGGQTMDVPPLSVVLHLLPAR